jgi:hypothetical protein
MATTLPDDNDDGDPRNVPDDGETAVAGAIGDVLRFLELEGASRPRAAPELRNAARAVRRLVCGLGGEILRDERLRGPLQLAFGSSIALEWLGRFAERLGKEFPECREPAIAALRALDAAERCLVAQGEIVEVLAGARTVDPSFFDPQGPWSFEDATERLEELATAPAQEVKPPKVSDSAKAALEQVCDSGGEEARMPPSSQKVWDLMVKNSPSFTPALDIEDAHRGSTKATALISHLKSRHGKRIESADEARRRGATDARGAKGHRPLERP